MTCVTALKQLVLVLAIAGICVACSFSVYERKVGSHIFRVPAENLAAKGLPWWQGHVDNFSFVLDPTQPLEAQATALIQTTAGLCKGELAGAQPRLQTCGVAPIVAVESGELGDIHRAESYAAGMDWTYRNGAGLSVASCFPLGKPSALGGSCTALVRYKDIAAVLMFPERDVPKLAALAAQMQAQLSAWERR